MKGLTDMVIAIPIMLVLALILITLAIVNDLVLTEFGNIPNLPSLSTTIFNQAKTSIWRLANLVPIIVIGIWLGSIILAWVLPSHPVFFVLYVLSQILMIGLAMASSNALWDFLNSDTISDYQANFTLTRYFVRFFPPIMIVFSTIYAIVLYSRIGEGGMQYGDV